ncbi:MAG: AAA family ATPase [Bacteroidia bacterium]|nr:AAA family ATPase [Bacteroidia bacterium]
MSRLLVHTLFDRELRRTAEGIAYDEMPMTELSSGDLDAEAIRAAFGEKEPVEESQLITLKLLVEDQGRLVPTRGGMLLFGKDRQRYYSDAWVQCGRFLGTEKKDIFDHVNIDKPLPQAVDEIMLFLKKHAYRSADLSEIRRKDKWSIPLSILREAVINALVHADYSQRGAPTRVAFMDDRIEIENPGILLPGLTIADLRRGISKIRNPVIARVFRELGLIEQWGTGIRRIFDDARSLKLREPCIEEIGMHLRLTVFLQEPFRQEQQVSEQVGEQVDEQVSEQVGEGMATRVLAVCAEKPASKQDILSALGLSNAYMNYKRHILPLIECGYISFTIPEKTKSRFQKYRVTEQGAEVLKKGRQQGQLTQA